MTKVRHLNYKYKKIATIDIFEFGGKIRGYSCLGCECNCHILKDFMFWVKGIRQIELFIARNSLKIEKNGS
jgi:hypothetical protein